MGKLVRGIVSFGVISEFKASRQQNVFYFTLKLTKGIIRKAKESCVNVPWS